MWGTTKDVKVTREIACATCNGSGAAPGSKPETCKTLPAARARSSTPRASSWCRPRVRTAAAPARRSRIRATDCRGRGTKPETIDADASPCPPGVDDGQTLRLATRARRSPAATTGHLYVVLHVQGDERFKRDGDDILTEMPVSFVKAALGGELEIHTLEDSCNGTRRSISSPARSPAT